ncbi:MAG: MazG family protein [Verrucomicrobia bacterium]|nr:MazG family protein [Verrucomicrobiota bacterium]
MALAHLLEIMARLRAPDGCPWDRVQNHRTLRWHAVEEVYELLDAIEAGDDLELEEELGDLLLQIVFHCQLARERGAFDFERVTQRLIDKLIHRHPHVFGQAQAKNAAAVWAQWDRLKQAEKRGTRHERSSALDGIPKRLPALLRAQKLWKKATQAKLASARDPQRWRASRRVAAGQRPAKRPGKMWVAGVLFSLAQHCQERGWSAEELLRAETQRRERAWRRLERRER